MTRIKRVLPPLLFGLVLIAAWQLGLFHRIFQITQLQLPLPSAILSAFFSHLPRIWKDAGTTVGPALLGLLLGAALGYCAALIVTAHPVGAYGLLLLVTVVNAIPVIALAPLMNRWFTVPFVTKLAVILVAASGSMAVHAVHGLNDIDPARLDLMQSYAASRGEILRKLRIPNSLPSVFSGLKIGVSSAMLATIISEFFSKETSGLGYMIKHSLKVGNQKPLGWVYILAVSLFSIVLYGSACALERRAIRWHISQRSIERGKDVLT